LELAPTAANNVVYFRRDLVIFKEFFVSALGTFISMQFGKVKRCKSWAYCILTTRLIRNTTNVDCSFSPSDALISISY
jgi:hypothetical protein